MLMSFSLELVAIFIAILALAVACGALLIERKQRLNIESELIQLEKSITDIRAELSNVSFGALGVGQRLKYVEKRLSSPERQAQGTAIPDGAGPYRKAIELVESGAGVDKLIEQCGLTRAEAELLCLMHQSLSGFR